MPTLGFSGPRRAARVPRQIADVGEGVRSRISLRRQAVTQAAARSSGKGRDGERERKKRERQWSERDGKGEREKWKEERERQRSKGRKERGGKIPFAPLFLKGEQDSLV